MRDAAVNMIRIEVYSGIKRFSPYFWCSHWTRSAMKLFLKYSKLCENHTWTSGTDGRHTVA